MTNKGETGEDEMLDEGLDALWLWASAQGVELLKCKPSLVEGGGWRGIVATETIQPRSVCVRVPAKCIMKPNKVAESTGDLPKLSSIDRLAVQLLVEKGKGAASRYATYIRELPRSYACLHQWNESAARELQDADFVAHHKSLRKDVVDDFQRLRDAQAHFHFVKASVHRESDETHWLEEYLWARSTILSRSVYLPQEGNEAGGLCPIGDLFNYYPPPGPQPLLPQPFLDAIEGETDEMGADAFPDATESFEGIWGDGHWEERTSSFVFKTGDRTYRKGEQIHLCYGQYSNRQLLEIYGFLLMDNPQESVPLASIIPQHHMRSWVMGAQDQGLYEVYQNGYPSWDLLCLVRWAAACEKEGSVFEKARASIQQGSMVSVDLEKQAFVYLHNLCAEKLRRFATTAAEDLTLLNDLEGRSSSSSDGEESAEDEEADEKLEHLKLAIRWRLCQKQVLDKAMTLCVLYEKHLTRFPELYNGW